MVAVLVIAGSLLDAPPPAEPPTDPIQAIRERFQAIENADLRETTREFVCEDCRPEGRLVGSYDGKQLRRIVQTYNIGDHCGYTRKYYYWNDELFFAFLSEGCWTFTGESEGPLQLTRDDLSEWRYYFHAGELIRVLRKEGVGDSLANVANEKMPESESDARDVKKAAAEARRYLETGKGEKAFLDTF